MKLKWMYQFLIGLGLAFPAVIAADSQPVSAVESLKALFNAIANLLKGNISGFVQNLRYGIIVIAVFLITWQLFKYIGRITVFRGEEGTQAANLIGVGLGLMAVSFPPVYSFISSFVGVNLIMLLFLLTIGFMLYQFIVKNRSYHGRDRANRLRNKTEALKAERDVIKEEHEKKLEQRLAGKEESAINSIETTLGNADFEVKNAREAVKAIRTALLKLGSPSSSEASENYMKKIMSRLSSLTGVIKREREDILKLLGKSKNLDKMTLKELDMSETDDSKLLTALKNHLKNKFLREKKYDNESDAVAAIAKYESELTNLLKKTKTLNTEIEGLENKVNGLFTEELRDDNMVDSLVSQLTMALNSGDYPSAINALNQIESYLNRISEVTKGSLNIEKTIRSLTAKKIQIRTELLDIERKITS